MGGRGSKSGFKSLGTLTDSTDFNSFVRANMSNPEFKQFGREQGMAAVKELWRETRREAELSSLHEISYDSAVEQIADAVPNNILSGWFRNADSDYKPQLIDTVLSKPGTLNAGLNLAYHQYAEKTDNPQSFQTWLRTPQTMYRGEHGQSAVVSDVFKSYSPDKATAQKFATGADKSVTQIKIRPIDTYGNYSTYGEMEMLVPVKKKTRG